VFRLVFTCATTTFDGGADDCARLFDGVVVVVVVFEDGFRGGGFNFKEFRIRTFILIFFVC
jgi:hypothetical protein